MEESVLGGTLVYGTTLINGLVLFIIVLVNLMHIFQRLIEMDNTSTTTLLKASFKADSVLLSVKTPL